MKPILFLVFLVLTGLHCPLPAQSQRAFPERVLITNDNGIHDPKIHALAKAFAAVSETWVVASEEDRSGTGITLTIHRTPSFRVSEKDLGEGIRAFALQGNPGDCVAWALTVLLKDNPPDLVVSGINGGPNLGHEWLYSGTVGAARLASYFGLPAIAVSGLDDDYPDHVAAATQWVVDFSRSSLVKQLEPPNYFTVSIPPQGGEGIKGVRVCGRTAVNVRPQFSASEKDERGTQIWRLTGLETQTVEPFAGTDRQLFEAGYVVVVPMRIDEHDHANLSRARKIEAQIPSWPKAKH